MQSKELGRARESYAKLQLSMEITEKKQRDAEESYNLSAEQAKQAVQSIEKSIKQKQEIHNRTIDKVREKCLFQFETQRANYNKYSEMTDKKQNEYSEKALNKFNTIR